ncbi:MBL fold metallo-hydrolase [Roseateles sp. YR242]|uniref:MBL fold metallo-hydrolase n=1 Tax=Roseateles sp. YR242 TaxID=1855305 RepID=UPI002101766C|nr:MBL fold metallo-hydrolase [Roseateles sp. YR242]
MSFATSLARGAGALLLGLLAHTLTLAAADVSQVPPPGIYRFRVGQLDVTALSDGTHPFPVDTVMVGASGPEIGDALEHDFLDRPPAGSINAFLINTGKRLILVDAGAGALYGDCCGQVVQQIRAAGYLPEQVDLVLLTHLHKDHVGGITSGGRAVFPNAVVRASKTDVDYWTSAAAKAKAPEFLSTFFDAAAASLAPYKAAGRLQPISGPGPIEDGVEVLASPGHTPGHLSFAFTSRGQTLVVVGDLVHVAALQLPHPEVTVTYDSDGAEARKTRVGLLQSAAERCYLVAAAHISFPGVGHVRKAGNAFEWVPLNYEAAPTRVKGATLEKSP